MSQQSTKKLDNSETFQEGHALIVGTGTNFRGNLTARYKSFINDAEWMAMVLETFAGFPKHQITLLTGIATTRDRILTELDNLRTRVSDRATIVIFLSMHSCCEEQYLVPYGINVKEHIDTEHIDSGLIYEKLQLTGADNVLVLLNSAGGFIPKLRDDDQLNILSKIKNFAFLAASQLDQGAETGYVSQKNWKRYSAFTIGLASGFRRYDRQGRIYVHDLVSACITCVSQKTSCRQIPYFDYTGDNFAITSNIKKKNSLLTFPLNGLASRIRRPVNARMEAVLEFAIKIEKFLKSPCYASNLKKLAMLKLNNGFPNDEENLHKFLIYLYLSTLKDYLVLIPYHEFHNVEKLGEGGFGSVWKATVTCRQGVEKIVALRKLVTSSFVLEQILNEFFLNIYIRMQHVFSRSATPRLIGLSVDDESDHYILVMEYAAGGSLEDFLKQSPLDSWLHVWRIAVEITRRLQVVHEAGVIHSNLHPGNIVFRGNAGTHSMIIDIGIGNTIESLHNRPNEVYGRIEYLPPEAFTKSQMPFTRQYDIYCLGTLLWQLTAQFSPRGTARDSPYPDLVDELREEPVPGTPIAYEEIYRKCWKLDPKDRPTVDEVLSDLESIEEELVDAKWLDEIPQAVRYLAEMKARCNCPSKTSFAFVNGATFSQHYTQEELQNKTLFNDDSRMVSDLSQPIDLQQMLKYFRQEMNTRKKRQKLRDANGFSFQFHKKSPIL
ncbi:kinase-like domain-containing protein [Endogone sp. FLAS-F59071]|nr:kinase-like domain-containing protein [Endogone sp. FLAS-F59071]|eukprot:RUS17574.1 kinase-like domain-containing protein [Endogone sp. FLAS-F59071]